MIYSYYYYNYIQINILIIYICIKWYCMVLYKLWICYCKQIEFTLWLDASRSTSHCAWTSADRKADCVRRVREGTTSSSPTFATFGGTYDICPTVSLEQYFFDLLGIKVLAIQSYTASQNQYCFVEIALSIVQGSSSSLDRFQLGNVAFWHD